MRNTISICNLEVGYKQRHPLYKPLNAALNQGDMVALAGPNGTGKTSLLRTLTGNIKPLSGSVSIMGKDINTYSIHERSLLFSIVLTEHPDDSFMKVLDVVATGRYPHLNLFSKLTDKDFQIVEQSLQTAGAKHLIDRTFVSLSDGEKQKVMIAKAIAQDTPILFMDEPMAFLDFSSKLELMTLLEELSVTQKKTIVFSSHDLETLMRHNCTMWLLAPNRELVSGKADELAAKGIIDDYFSIPQDKGFKVGKA